MELILVGINILYIASLVVTWQWYPPQPIYDLETDEVIGETKGVTKWNFIWLILFSLISRWGYHQINTKNQLGVRPETCLDVFGVNLLT